MTNQRECERLECTWCGTDTAELRWTGYDTRLNDANPTCEECCPDFSNVVASGLNKLFLCYVILKSRGSHNRCNSISRSCSSRSSHSSSSSRRGIRVYCSQISHNLRSHRDS